MQTPLFEINDLTLQEGQFRALDIKKFEIHRGTIYAISGKPASGKTVLMQVLFNKIKPNSGKIKFDGKDLNTLSSAEFYDNIAIVPQSIKVPWGTVNKYMRKTLNKYSHTKNDIENRIDAICEKMEIAYLLEHKMKSLTPGQLRWVELATKIAADTKVLLIDEIEQHLSYDALNNLIRILHKKSNYDGVTIVMSTMNPEKLKKMVSVYISIQGGRIASVRSYNKVGYKKNRPRQRKRPRNQNTPPPRKPKSN